MPCCLPKWFQTAPKIHPKSKSKSIEKTKVLFDDSKIDLRTKMLPKPTKQPSKVPWFFDCFVLRVWVDFGMGFTPPDPWFLQTRLSAVPFFIFRQFTKIKFFHECLDAFCLHFPLNFLPKWLPNFVQEIHSFSIDVGIDVGSIWDPTRCGNRIKIPSDA